jgi:hypothetical protein
LVLFLIKLVVSSLQNNLFSQVSSFKTSNFPNENNTCLLNTFSVPSSFLPIRLPAFLLHPHHVHISDKHKFFGKISSPLTFVSSHDSLNIFYPHSTLYYPLKAASYIAKFNHPCLSPKRRGSPQLRLTRFSVL